MKHSASWNSVLLSLQVGERRYFDTTIESYAQQMRTMNTPKSRRPSQMHDMQFCTSLFTAVSATKAGDVRLVICLERLS